MVVFDLGDRIVVAVPATHWRERLKADYRREREEGLDAARDFRRRMDEAYAAADFPIERRRGAAR